MNESVINGLNDAGQTSGHYAYLTDELNKSVYTFLFNPEEKSFSRQARYAEGQTALTSIQSQFYINTTGLTLRLSNLLLETYNSGKTCQLLLDRLQLLMVADVIKGNFAPTPVFFKWGGNTFGPAVITDLSWNETGWLNGEVSSARVNFTLLEIPDKQLPNKVKILSSAERLQAAKNTAVDLTDRERYDGSVKAKIWLTENNKKLKDAFSSLVKTNSYKLSTYKDGVVAIFDTKNKQIGVVGVYKDGKLDTTKGDLLK